LVPEFKPPDLNGRKQLLKKLLHNQNGGEEMIDEAPKMTGGHSGAQIHELVILAKKEALKLGEVDDNGIVKLKGNHFETAIERMKKKKDLIMGFKSS
jgi:SpoVK/Ycf46/Vps4 family AAA+-type ATPase